MMVKMEQGHATLCWAQQYENESERAYVWFIPRSVPRVRLAKDGTRKGQTTTFIRVQCNNFDCQATALVRERDITDAIQMALE